MPSFTLYDLNPDFWQRVRAKADAEGTTVKAVILRLLSQWLAAVLVLLLGAACGYKAPSAPTPPVTIVPVVVMAPTELVGYHAPLGVYAGGATQIHVGAFGPASDGTIRGIAGVPVVFTTDAGDLLPFTSVTGITGFGAVAILTVSKQLGGREIHVSASAGGLSTVVTVRVMPEGVYPEPTVPTIPTPATPATPTRP